MDQIATAGNKGERVRSDCFVSLQLKQSGGITIQLKSKVESNFGSQIRGQALKVLESLEVSHASVELIDAGALPFVIAARLEAAVRQLKSTNQRHVPPMIPQNLDKTSRDRFRFSRLYLPGNTPSMMLNAGLHYPDGIILDLEDSVAPGKKAEARLLVRNALCQVDFYGAERMVRINQLPAGLDDLDDIIPRHVHLVLIPKCETGSQVKQVEERITSILDIHQMKREVFLMPIIESALGVENAFHMATSSDLVVAMAIGLEDYTADLGVKRTIGGDESLYARTRLVNACKAAGIQPIDSVFSDVADMEGLKKNVERSRSLGFEGMGCIHPRQVQVIHEGFCPNEAEVRRAETIIAAFEDAEARGLGVIALGTKMIDLPVVKRAQQTMELALRFGLRKQTGLKQS
ncbi:MAG: citrate lyase subunit beta [Bacteroidales bacterium]|nr:citrate lyase subunit beta [Bacteroidales bacterium]